MDNGFDFLEVRQRFLPLKLSTLRQRMLADPRLSPEQREQLGTLFEMLAARFHFEFHEELEHLKSVYDALDPDAETLSPEGAAIGRPAQREELAAAFERLLTEANYVEMPREQAIVCAEYQSQTGLVVGANFSDYAQLRVFYRGLRPLERTFRPWYAPWLRKPETVHVFSRLALLVQLAKEPDGPTYLKLFKNVVAEDLEMLLPYVRIRMRMRDHLKIGSSLAGGVATAGWKAFTAAILSPVVFMIIMAGFAGALTRAVFSFFSSKTRYLQTLTSSLYFQNLANNSSVLAHLVDAAETEECKETLLAYYMLYVERDQDYADSALDARVEQWLQTEFGLDVDFEVADALRKLEEKGLLVRRAPGGTGGDVLKVYDLPSSLRRLDAVWDDYFRYTNTAAPEQDRLAEAHWPPCPVRSAVPGRLLRADAGDSATGRTSPGQSPRHSTRPS